MPGCRVELRLIRIQYPYLDSSILAEYIALNAGKYNFFKMQKMVFKKAPTVKTEGTMTKEKTPNLLTGIKLELSGRLTTQHSTPRKTVENQHTGTLNKGYKFADSKKDSLNLNQYASKNKKGAYTVKV